MTKLTQKSVKFDWGEKAKAAFQLLKKKLCSAPILALPEGSANFVVYCDASHKGLGSVLMQSEKVQMIENKAKTALSSILHEGISPQPRQLPRGDTWTPLGCHVATVDPLTRLLTGGQRPLIGGSVRGTVHTRFRRFRLRRGFRNDWELVPGEDSEASRSHVASCGL
ncbi:putative reverse transcriptase domain-containing protein [Tanacetum coccineum]